jgi:cation/acetate symporter
MSSQVYERIRRNPKFDQLVARRTRFAGILSVIVLAIFYGFVMVVAFNPSVIGERIAEGSTLTVGVLSGLFMFVFFWVLTAVYVRRANSEFDDLTTELINDAMKEPK